MTLLVVISASVGAVIAFLIFVRILLHLRRRKLQWVMNEMLRVKENRIARVRAEHDLANARLQLERYRSQLEEPGGPR